MKARRSQPLAKTEKSAKSTRNPRVDHDDLELSRMTTIERRLDKIRSALVLIQNACKSDMRGDELMMEAIIETAESAHDEAHWISLLPGRVLNMPAPTDDDVEKWASVVLTTEELEAEREDIIVNASQTVGR